MSSNKSSPAGRPGNVDKFTTESAAPLGAQEVDKAPVSEGSPGTIQIFGPIGPGGYGLPDLRADLEKAKGRPVIEIHSAGGCVQNARAMARLIDDAQARVHTHSAASAAVLIASAGQFRSISENGWLGLHPVWSAVAGGAEQFEAAAKYFREIDNLEAVALASKSHWSEEDAHKAIKANRVLSADEALAAGLVDEIGPPSPYVKPKPKYLDDSRRAVDLMDDHARRHELLAEIDAIKAARDQADEIAPSPTPEIIMAQFEALIQSDRRAGIFRAAANHARVDSDIWPAWWACPDCGSRNYTAPVTGWLQTECAYCVFRPVTRPLTRPVTKPAIAPPTQPDEEVTPDEIIDPENTDDESSEQE